MIWIERLPSLPDLNSRKWNTASSSALAGNIWFYSSLNARLFPKSQEIDHSLRFLNLSQQSSRIHTGISSTLACRPKSTAVPGELEASLEETQWGYTVCSAGGSELVGQTGCPSVAMHRVVGPGDPLPSEANLMCQLTTLQRCGCQKVDSELHEILPQPCKGCLQLLLLFFLSIVSSIILLSVYRQWVSACLTHIES